MRRLIGLFLFSWVAGVLPAPGALAQAQPAPEVTAEDQQVVDGLFRDKITAVRRSREQDDDAVLIAEMLETAAQVPDSPGAQWLIYETAVELGMSTGAYVPAIDAAMQRRAAFPGTEETGDAALLALMQEAYRGARRDERDAIAEPYLDFLLTMGASAEAAGDDARAGVLYREGVTVARAVRSPVEAEFAEHVRRLNAVEQMNSRIRLLTNALEVNPRNVSAASDLTMLIVLERRDLAAAAEFVELTRDPELIDVVRMGAPGVDAADAPAALRVGDWYYRLSETEPDHQDYLLNEATAFYDRFLSVYPREDALRVRVVSMRKQATDRLEAIASAAEEAARGTWRDALAQVNPREHSLGDNPVLARNGRLYSDHTNFVVPVTPGPAYDLRFTVELDEGEDGIVLYLPLGEGGAVFQYSRWNHTRIQFDGGGRNEAERFMLVPGRSVEVLLEVDLLDEGRARLAASVDGEACLTWEGDVSDLGRYENRRALRQHGNVFVFGCAGRYIFSAIQVRQPDN